MSRATFFPIEREDHALQAVQVEELFPEATSSRCQLKGIAAPVTAYLLHA